MNKDTTLIALELITFCFDAGLKCEDLVCWDEEDAIDFYITKGWTSEETMKLAIKSPKYEDFCSDLVTKEIIKYFNLKGVKPMLTKEQFKRRINVISDFCFDHSLSYKMEDGNGFIDLRVWDGCGSFSSKSATFTLSRTRFENVIACLEQVFGIDHKPIVKTETNSTSLEIKKVHFNNPATIIFWVDGTKTVVKAQGDDKYDPEKGLAMAIAKKTYGNKGNYCEVFKHWLKETDNEN